jgi:hypothetical protein
MTTQTHSAAELEELLAEEIPCGGVRHLGISCNRAAQLKVHAHSHPECVEPAHLFKCIQCWQSWYIDISQYIAADGAVACRGCHRAFPTVNSFAEYRPF